VVDQSTLWTARWLAQMPTTAEERQVAEDALHLADKEMDLAFATTVREGSGRRPLSHAVSCYGIRRPVCVRSNVDAALQDAPGTKFVPSNSSLQWLLRRSGFGA